MGILYEYYDVNDSAAQAITTVGGFTSHMQTFTPQEGFSLGSVRVKVYRFGTAATLGDLRIFGCDGDGHPVWADNKGSADNISFNGMTTDTDGEWFTFTFGTPINLVGGTKYAMDIIRPTGVSLWWKYDPSTGSAYTRGTKEVTAGDAVYTTQDGDFMFETWSGVDLGLRSYTLRGVTDDKGRPIAEAWCRAYNSSDQTNLVLVETKYTDENGMTEFTRLPDDAPVDICVIWGSHVIWYRNVFDADGSSIDDAVTKAHTQNTDTQLTTDGTTALITTGTLKANLAVDANVTIDGIDVSAHAILAATDTVLGHAYMIDEDNMVSDSATKVPTQQSVKAYVDTTVGEHDTFIELDDTPAAYAGNAGKFCVVDATPDAIEFIDHTGAADPHTVYRLESADHSHQSTGAQAGQLDHGLALTGLTDDDHTQYILKTLLDADTVLTATTDNTPVATTMAEQTVLGRLTGGHPDDIVIGIADNNIVQIDQADTADNDFAKFTASGLEGRSYTELRSDINVADGADVTGSNAPQAHAASHAVSGSDTVFPADPNADKYLMWDDDPGELVWADVAGGGDVTGPAASTDNMIARHHSTGGKTLQDYTSNPPTIGDTGDVNIDGDLDVENIVVSGTVDGVDVSAHDASLTAHNSLVWALVFGG